MDQTTEKVKACLDIARIVSPKNAEQNIRAMIKLVPDLESEILQRIDIPLKVHTKGKRFILCEYNRDGDSYRSPWDNTFYPPIESEFFPSPRLRKLEEAMNKVLETYRDFYYGESAVCSAYFWDLDDGNNFACAVVSQNVVHDKVAESEEARRFFSRTTGTWNSINVISATALENEKFNYRCFNTCYVEMVTHFNDGDNDTADVNGYYITELQKDLGVPEIGAEAAHVRNLGQLVEEVEVITRNRSLEVFIHRMQGVTMGLLEEKMNEDQQAVVADLNQAIEKLGARRKGLTDGLIK